MRHYLIGFLKGIQARGNSFVNMRMENSPDLDEFRTPPESEKISTHSRASENAEDPPEISTDDLLKSANIASGTARNAWLAFLVLMAYLLVTLAGVTHKDLLLNSPIKLPIILVEIPLISFFWVVPILLLLIHLGLLVQHAMLAHKFILFSTALLSNETGNSRDHPDRIQVNSYVFSQLLAGPKPSQTLESLMRLMVFVSLSLLPVLVLLYFQIKFLPYHDMAATDAHRLAIVLDLGLLLSLRPFKAMLYTRPTGRKLPLGSETWPWELSYWSLGTAAVSFLALFGLTLHIVTLNPKLNLRWPASNIVVTDMDLVPNKDDIYGEVSFSLRGRDLRFATLDRSDLHRADMYDVDVRSASLIGTILNKTNLQWANLQWANLEGANLEGANLQETKLQKANLQEANLQEANLQEANLQEANLEGAKLQGANLQGANLQGANLQEAIGITCETFSEAFMSLDGLTLHKNKKLRGNVKKFSIITIENTIFPNYIKVTKEGDHGFSCEQVEEDSSEK